MDKETEQMITEMVDGLKENSNGRKCAPEIDEVCVSVFENDCGKDKSFDELLKTIDKTNIEKRSKIDEEGEIGLKENGNGRKSVPEIDEVCVSIFGNDCGKDKSFDETIYETNVEKRPRIYEEGENGLKDKGNVRKSVPEIDEVCVSIFGNDCAKDKSFDETIDKTNVEKRLGIDEEGENGLKENGNGRKCVPQIDEVCVSIFGNDCGKVKYFDQTNVEKRPRRRGNSRKKAEAVNSCNGSGICVVTESQNKEKKCGGGSKTTYSREEMEALRFVDVEAQKNKWVEVYCRLGSDVVKEYDALANCTQKRQNQLDFDPRKQFQSVERKHDVHGEEGVHLTDNETENVNPSNPISCGEEDDSDDDCNSILRPAFFVSGEPKFDSGPPQDGFEYLRRVRKPKVTYRRQGLFARHRNGDYDWVDTSPQVLGDTHLDFLDWVEERWEAERIPKVKVAKLEKSKLNKEQTVYMPSIPDIEKCPEYLLPMKEWEVTFLAEFSKLRLVFSRVDSSSTSSSAIVKLPSQVDEEESNTQLPRNLVETLNNISSEEVRSFADPASSEDVTENADCKTCVNGISEEFPTLSMILKMDSVARLLMLRRRISSVANMTSLSKSDCVWLFSLCVAIDTPLDGDTCASLRCLLRKVASLRAGKSEMDDECIMLNIIATIAGKYFGQSG